MVDFIAIRLLCKGFGSTTAAAELMGVFRPPRARGCLPPAGPGRPYRVTIRVV
jgi:hypothetical protein